MLIGRRFNVLADRDTGRLAADDPQQFIQRACAPLDRIAA
jgi:hypothetical protein